MSFYEWLKTQVGRDDPIGDFAADAMRDKDAARLTSQAAWDNHLSAMGASYAARDAMRQAFKEYRNVRR